MDSALANWEVCYPGFFVTRRRSRNHIFMELGYNLLLPIILEAIIVFLMMSEMNLLWYFIAYHLMSNDLVGHLEKSLQSAPL